MDVCAIFKHWDLESKIFYRLNTLYSPSAHSLPFKDTKLSIQILTSIYDAGDRMINVFGIDQQQNAKQKRVSLDTSVKHIHRPTHAHFLSVS